GAMLGGCLTVLCCGMNGLVSALAVSGGVLYAGGMFATAGGIEANCIARWNGSSWTALGSGMETGTFAGYPSVSALAVSGSNLYAGAISRLRVAARPITSPNGTGAVGRLWVRGSVAAAFPGPVCSRWRCR